MTRYFITAVIISFFFSCSNNSQQASAPVITDSTEKDTLSFFPVTSFIKGQISILDSLPVTPLQITTIKEKTDSAWIPKSEMRTLLMPFLSPEIKETNLINYFKETKFNDQTLNAITFTYDPTGIIPDSISLRHWDVYVDPEKGNVVKVYIVKTIKENGRLLTIQLTWQTNKLAKISTILNKPDGTMELLKEQVFTWNFN